MQRYLNQLSRFDWVLLFAALILVLFGLAAIYSVALSQEASNFWTVKKQLIALVIGLGVILVLTFSNYRLLRNYSLVIYIFGVVLLILVLFFGQTIRGTTGWFNILGFSFQPVEFMKIALPVYLATYFSEFARRRFAIREFFISGLIAGLPVGLVMMQPDFGSAVLLLGTWVIMIFFAGMRQIHFIVLAAAGVLTGLIGWFFVFADYQKSRISSFLNPTADPLGEGYNVAQAIIAVGAGSWLGRGLGFGSQSQLKFLPESQTDFVFAVVAEELGFLGVMVVLICFAIIFHRVYLLTKTTSDNFTSFLMLGLMAVIFIQMFINIGMNIGLLPVTGIALPFVSAGGSSLLITLMMIGIIESVATNSRG